MFTHALAREIGIRGSLSNNVQQCRSTRNVKTPLGANGGAQQRPPQPSPLWPGLRIAAMWHSSPGRIPVQYPGDSYLYGGMNACSQLHASRNIFDTKPKFPQLFSVPGRSPAVAAPRS